MKGRKPLPSIIKKLRGTDQPCRMNEKEPQPAPLPPDPPEHLSDRARGYWTEIFNLLANVGVLSEMDADSLVLYCENKAKWMEATDQINKEGYVITTPNGFLAQSPWLQVQNKAFDQMFKLLTEFGMTPSSRTRIKIELPENEPNPFDEF